MILATTAVVIVLGGALPVQTIIINNIIAWPLRRTTTVARGGVQSGYYVRPNTRARVFPRGLERAGAIGPPRPRRLQPTACARATTHTLHAAATHPPRPHGRENIKTVHPDAQNRPRRRWCRVRQRRCQNATGRVLTR